jgi:hypothetical protein
MENKFFYYGFYNINSYDNYILKRILIKLSRIYVTYLKSVFDDVLLFDEKNQITENGVSYINNFDNNNDTLFLKDKNNFFFSFGKKRNEFDFINFQVKKNMNFNDFDDIINGNIKIAFFINYNYNFTQSEVNPSAYIYQKMPYAHLKKVFNKNLQMELIDISRNQGRERFLGDISFFPAYKIWYGKEAQDLFGKQKILDYPNAIYIKELENGVIEMQLMDDITKCDLPYNQEKQRDIVKYFEIEKLEVPKY